MHCDIILIKTGQTLKKVWTFKDFKTAKIGASILNI